MASTSGAPTGRFRVDVESQGKTVVLAVTGELDMLTAPRLEEATHQTLENSPQALILDLTNVTFLSSAGISVLVSAHKHAGDRTDILIVASETATLRPLQLMGLDHDLTLYDTRDEALAAAPS